MDAAVFQLRGFCPNDDAVLEVDLDRMVGTCSLCGGEFHHPVLEHRLRMIEAQIARVEAQRRSEAYLDAPVDHRWVVVVNSAGAVWVEGRFRNQDEAEEYKRNFRPSPGIRAYSLTVARLEEPRG